MNDNPIGFFDSGIGGATILKEVIKRFPNENYIYYADNANNPYGNKSKKELLKIVDNIVKILITYNCKIIVCACNTVTTMVLNDIRKKYKYITFVGTVPAIKVVYDNYKDKNCLVLTTKGTGENKFFKQLFNDYKTHNCILVKVHLLAGLIEQNTNTFDYLKELLVHYKEIEIIVLGCTHFLLIKNEIKKILGNVKFVDGSLGITNRIEYLLNKNNLNSKKYNCKIKIICSGNDVKKRIKNIIKKD